MFQFPPLISKSLTHLKFEFLKIFSQWVFLFRAYLGILYLCNRCYDWVWTRRSSCTWTIPRYWDKSRCCTRSDDDCTRPRPHTCHEPPWAHSHCDRCTENSHPDLRIRRPDIFHPARSTRRCLQEKSVIIVIILLPIFVFNCSCTDVGRRNDDHLPTHSLAVDPSLYPSGHWHSNEPGVLTHWEMPLHGAGMRRHSLSSETKN